MHETVIFEGDALIVRERVRVRLALWGSRVFLERELTQADGTSFVHSLAIDTEPELYDYITADPYFQQLRRHYNMVQEKYQELIERRMAG